MSHRGPTERLIDYKKAENQGSQRHHERREKGTEEPALKKTSALAGKPHAIFAIIRHENKSKQLSHRDPVEENPGRN